MDKILSLLPGYNCGSCGFKQCKDFAAQITDEATLTRCPFLEREIFRKNLEQLKEIVGKEKIKDEVIGIIDGLKADFSLGPLHEECSCREDIHPLDGSLEIEIGDILHYRPLGCPVTHFAKVIDKSPGIFTVHIVGPLHRLGKNDFSFKDAGLCMILAFEGLVVKGKVPSMCQTVKFLPEHCMMQKVHSGIVVSVEGRRLRIEAIDLKVW
ncbi:(Fe-S)-binding protein [uncultured Methanomethylovorans sp.]|uniref:(Fe-S)-binding protein n=1 Tax=uncultured Methanomethylovorans sp. TaxID=183759 RepID=UPI002AA6CE6C|nr:(Fe-S)-binding protein [uncultured Methanomethylovorans sp.]